MCFAASENHVCRCLSDLVGCPVARDVIQSCLGVRLLEMSFRVVVAGAVVICVWNGHLDMLQRCSLVLQSLQGCVIGDDSEM